MFNIPNLTFCTDCYLQIIRYSATFNIADRFYSLLDALMPEINRLSILCCLHMAILGTTVQLAHKESLKLIAEKIAVNVSNPNMVRLKDMERILLGLTSSGFNPRTTPDIFDTICEELHKESRLSERILYPRCFVCALQYLSINNIYPEELITQAFDKDVIINVYGTYYQ